MEPFSTAAVSFAANLIRRQATDLLFGWFKIRRLRASTAAAYNRAAAAAIDGCGLPNGSPAWQKITALLGDPGRASEVARLMRTTGISSDAILHELKLANPDAERVLDQFTGLLSSELQNLIPLEDRPAIQVVLQALAALQRAMEQRLVLTRFDHRWQRRESIKWDEAPTLSAYSRSVPLEGRAADLEELRGWLASPCPVSVRVLSGDVGRGKTRLALSLCEAVARDGWAAGFVRDGELRGFPQRLALEAWKWDRPTLIVIDYAAQRSVYIHDWLVALAANSARITRMSPPLRMLLLDRSAYPGEGWWRVAFGVGGSETDDILGMLDPPRPIEVNPLTDLDDRERLARHVLSQMLPEGEIEARLPGALSLADDWGSAGDPLLIMLASLAIATGNGAVPGRHKFARSLALREQDRLSSIAKSRGSPPELVLHLAALATLSGGFDRNEALRVAGCESRALGYGAVNLPELISVLQQALMCEPEGGVGPVLPDLIGEAFVLGVLKQTDSQAAIRRCIAALTNGTEKSPRLQSQEKAP